MTSDNTSTPCETLNFGFSDMLGVAPMPAPQPGTTGYRRTVRLANELKKTAATLAAMSSDERRFAAFETVRNLVDAPHGRPRLKIPSQPGNPDDVGAIFFVILKELFGILERGRRPNGLFSIDDSERTGVECLIWDVRSDRSAALDVRTLAIEALAELMTTAGFGTSPDSGISAAA